VCLLPVPAGTFALLDDLVDGGLRGGEISDRDQLRPAEQPGCRLRAGRAHKQRALAEPGGEGGESSFDAAVQMADRHELLSMWHQLAGVERFQWWRGRNKAFGVLALHAFRPLQIEEVQQRRLAERQQVQLHAGGEVARPAGEVGPAERGSSPDRRHQIGDKRQVQHLLDSDAA
jgi:hypothetical protein